MIGHYLPGKPIWVRLREDWMKEMLKINICTLNVVKSAIVIQNNYPNCE